MPILLCTELHSISPTDYSMRNTSKSSFYNRKMCLVAKIYSIFLLFGPLSAILLMKTVSSCKNLFYFGGISIWKLIVTII